MPSWAGPTELGEVRRKLAPSVPMVGYAEALKGIRSSSSEMRKGGGELEGLNISQGCWAAMPGVQGRRGEWPEVTTEGRHKGLADPGAQRGANVDGSSG